MNRKRRSNVILGLSCLMALAAASGCSERRPTEAETAPVAEYLGSGVCGGCHESIHTGFTTTGHPFVLSKMSDGVLPTYPAVTPGLGGAGNPPYFSWTDVTYAVGGFGWKARFVGQDGYIITSGGENQFNLSDSTWTDYRRDEEAAFDCGPCHTTGYDMSGHQDGLEGIVGTWALSGVQCEACHGPGSLHASDPYETDMVVDRSALSCAKCHSRGDPSTLPAGGGFIKHYAQYNELQASDKGHLACVTCHDPHKPSHWSSEGIKFSCESCHPGRTIEIPQKSNFECVDCHMPFATVSAKSLAEYKGDVRTHLFEINTDSLAEMFDTTGSFANGYLTIEYSCMYGYCHNGDTKGYLSQAANLIH